MFRNMHYGIKFGLNHNMQTALAFSSFESSYYLLPPEGLDLVQDENGNLHSLDLYNSKSWQDNRYGLFHENCGWSKDHHGEEEARFKFVDHHLKRSKKFHQLMNAPIEVHPTKTKPILYLRGHGQQTVHYGVWLKKHETPNTFLYYPKHFKRWKIKIDPKTVYGDGDSTVPDFSLKLPLFLTDLKTTEVVSKQSHLDVLQSAESRKVITEWLSY